MTPIGFFNPRNTYDLYFVRILTFVELVAAAAAAGNEAALSPQANPLAKVDAAAAGATEAAAFAAAQLL